MPRLMPTTGHLVCVTWIGEWKTRSGDGQGVGREARTSWRVTFYARWTAPSGIPHLEIDQEAPA